MVRDAQPTPSVSDGAIYGQDPIAIALGHSHQPLLECHRGDLVTSAQQLDDTSVFIARELRRLVDIAALPDRLAVSAITIGELRAGVLAATDAATRDRRLDTLTAALSLEPITIDVAVANAWARLRVALRDAGLRMPVNDSWIAATAMAHDIPVVTQDDDFPGLAELTVIHV